MSGKSNDPISEEDCGCYAESRTKKACPPVCNVTHPLRYYEFTQEEIKALEECDKESFYYRCLPFSTLFATATYAAIRLDVTFPPTAYFYGFFLGLLRRSPHWGVVPKVAAAALAGHLAGRVSYVAYCERKLRKKLPDNSYLGAVMRKHHDTHNPPPPDPKKK